ncbi:unnamed protein product [Knipowitschia caucasica]|uniref:Proton myo-inositol cotransporter n=1 Tax=Knipowitschia caucasica TaxID=637954 RepID=A0AAV2KXI7_KNICA
MLLLKQELSLSALWQELLVSSTVAAAALSALLGGPLNGSMGRRRCILLASFIFSLGGLLLSLAPNKEVLLVGRIVVGLGIGLASMTVPVYLAEVAPPHLRGQLVTVNALFITGGQFVAAVVDGAFSYVSHGWRFMLGLSVVPSLLQFVGFLFLPESPRWLLAKGRSLEAYTVLTRIRGRGAEEEYESIRLSVEEENKETGGMVLLRILAHGPTRRALMVGCGLQMFQQLSGINTVMYYSATILQMSGVRDVQTAIWLSAATAATNFLFTLLGVWLVESVGRRKLTLASLMGTCGSLLVLALGFLLSALTSPPVTLPGHNSSCSSYSACEGCMLDPDCGFCYKLNSSSVMDSSCVDVNPASTNHAAHGRCVNQTLDSSLVWAYNFCPSSFSWIIVVGLVLYLAAFAPGMGPMPWTVNSEIYPLWARSTGNACSAGVNWSFNVLVSLTFLHVAQSLTYYGVFFLYAGLVAVALLFVALCLPETRGLKLEEMEALFSGSQGPQVHYTRSVSGAAFMDGDIAHIILR